MDGLLCGTFGWEKALLRSGVVEQSEKLLRDRRTRKRCQGGEEGSRGVLRGGLLEGCYDSTQVRLSSA